MMKQLLLISILFLFCLSSRGQQQTIGLFQYNSLSYDGYTLFSPLALKNTYLIDNCGNEVHQWQGDYFPGLVSYLLPNGNLLQTGESPNAIFGTSGGGGIIVLYDWDGNKLWEYEIADSNYTQHHDIEYLPNGNILVLVWEYFSANDVISKGRNPATLNLTNALYSEAILEIKPLGIDSAEIVWEWHLLDHIIQDFDSTKPNYGVVANHPQRINLNYQDSIHSLGSMEQSDWVHANSIAYNAARDEIVIGSRNFSELWVIDHSTTTQEAATSLGGNSGKGGDILYRWGNPKTYNSGGEDERFLFSQHDVHWIPDSLPWGGRIMIFNNGIARTALGDDFSTIEVITPLLDKVGDYIIDTTNGRYGPEQTDWTYFGNPLTSFFSAIVSGSQMLPNGNILICEGDFGNFIELDTLSNIHWKYKNPMGLGGPASQGNTPPANTVFRAYRYSPTYSAFQGKTLTPVAPLEINPLPPLAICDTTVSTNSLNKKNNFIIKNPITHQLAIQNLDGKQITITIMDAHGRQIISEKSNDNLFLLEVEHWNAGIYFLTLLDTDFQLYTYKILKL